MNEGNDFLTHGERNAELEQTSLILEAVFNSISSGLEIYDKDGVMTDCNGYDLMLYGIERKEELLEQNRNLFKNPNFPQKDRDELLKGHNVEFELWYDFDKVRSCNYFKTSREGKIFIVVKGSPMYAKDKELIGYIFEINEKTRSKMQEMELQETHRNLTLALNAAKISTWKYDIKKKRLSTMLGETLVGMGQTYDEYERLLYPDDRAKMRKLLTDIISGRIEQGEIVLRYFDKSFNNYRYFESCMESRKNEDGEIDCIVGTQRDITEDTQKKLVIDNARKSLDMVMEASNILVWDYDMLTHNYRVLYGNRLLAKHPRILRDRDNLHPDDKRKFDGMIRQILDRKIDQCSMEVRVRDNRYEEEEYFYLEYTAMGITNDANKVIGLIGSMVDTTERRQKRDELEKSREELSMALDASGVTAWVYNVKEKIFHSLYGNDFSVNGLTEESCFRWIHPDDVAKKEKLFEDIKSGKRHHVKWMFRYSLSGDNNDYRYFECYMTGKIERGNVALIIGMQKDVTEAYLRQEELEENNKKSILINNVCGIARWDYTLSTHILVSQLMNAVMPNVSIDLEKNLKDYLRFSHPDDRNIVRGFIDEANEGHSETIHMDIRLRYSIHDAYSYHSFDGVAIRNDKGNIIKYTGIYRDVTRWLELNKQIAQQSVMNRIILNNITSGLLFFDANGILKWSNFYADNDILRKINIGKDPGKMVSDVLGKEIALGRNLSVKTRSIMSAEKKYGNMTVNFTCIPVEEESEVTGVLFKIDDISRLKQINEELQDAREKTLETNNILNELLDNIPCMMFIKNASNHFHYVMVNKVFCNYAKKTPGEVIGHTRAELFFDANDRDDNNARYDIIVAQNSKSYTYEETMIFDGVPSVLNVIKSSLKMKNGDIYIIGIATDISEVNKANAEREAAEKADQLKSAFLANMSHEIRTPLNSIVGFSQLLQSVDNDEERKEFIKIIDHNSNILLRLINDILDLSKIEAGIDLKCEPFDLSLSFDELFYTFSMANQNPNVEFLKKNPYERCIVNLDKQRVLQIENNLITNAIKHTVKGHILIGYEQVDEGIRFYVEDTGSGIPYDKQPLLFQRFEKLDDFTQGTGLGLAICKAIVDKAGGKIGFTSEEGKGSTFWVFLPVQDSEIICN